MAGRWQRTLSVAVALMVPAAALGQPMTTDDVITLVKNAISDTVIVAQIEETNSYFSLNTDDLIKLKGAGASDYLVNYLITRKPGGAAPVPATNGNSTGVTVRTGGRVSGGRVEGNTPPKFSDLTVTLSGKFVVKSQAGLNVYYAAYIDGERKYYTDQWTSILTLTTAETGASTTKRILEPGTFSIKVPVGTHTLTLVCWSGRQAPTDAVAKSSVIYTKQINVTEGQPLSINLTGETDPTSNRFVIVR